MGIFNITNQLPDSLKDKICPICNGTIIPRNLGSHEEADTFEFSCETCNPEIVVSLTASFMARITELNDNEAVSSSLKNKVKNWNSRVLTLSDRDLFG